MPILDVWVSACSSRTARRKACKKRARRQINKDTYVSLYYARDARLKSLRARAHNSEQCCICMNTICEICEFTFSFKTGILYLTKRKTDNMKKQADNQSLEV